MSCLSTTLKSTLPMFDLSVMLRRKGLRLHLTVWTALAAVGVATDSSAQAPVPAETAVATFSGLAHVQQALDQARANNERSLRDEVTAYCEHVRAAQRSETASLRSPWLAARGGTLQRGELTGNGQPVNPRFRLGAGFSVSDWLRADLLERHADNTCAVYEAQASLRSRSANIDALTLTGWRSKVRLLSEASAAAKTLLDRSEVELRSGERTIAEHLNLLSEHQRLARELSDSELQVARLATTTAPSVTSPRLLESLQNSVAEAERVEGELRRNKSLTIDVEGGYDEVIALPQTLPVYGQVNVTFRPGYFWQGAADATSRVARARAAALRVMNEDETQSEALLVVTARRDMMVEELKRLQNVLQILQQHHDQLKPIQRPDAQHLAERLWFQLVLSRAQTEYLDATVTAMTRWLETNSPNPPRTVRPRE